jgi:hypothetical protein
MGKEKVVKLKSDKKKAARSLKEKRADKKAKRADKNDSTKI